MAWMTQALAIPEPRTGERDHELTLIATFGMNRPLRTDLSHGCGVPVRSAFGVMAIDFGSTLLLSGEIWTDIGPCGKVMPRRDMMIADVQGNSLPEDVPGQLGVDRPGMLRGYPKNPDATAVAIHEKWFRTGDLCPPPDVLGDDFIVGRIEEMIRRSAAVAGHGVDDERRGEEVKAGIILRPGIGIGAVNPDRFVVHAAEHVAPLKLPRDIKFCWSCPMTSSCKISLRRLLDGEGEAIGALLDASMRWAVDGGVF